jgi:F0F1-type ATP synthase assembly protein I
MTGGQPGRERDTPTTQRSAAEEEELRRTRLKLIGLSFQFGFTIVGAFVLFMGGGFLLDRWLGTSPLFLLIGMVLAFIGIGYSLYEIATIGYKPRAAKAAAKGTAPAARPAPAQGWDEADPWAKDDWDRDDWKRDDDWPTRRRGEGQGGKEE